VATAHYLRAQRAGPAAWTRPLKWTDSEDDPLALPFAGSYVAPSISYAVFPRPVLLSLAAVGRCTTRKTLLADALWCSLFRVMWTSEWKDWFPPVVLGLYFFV